MTMAINDTVGFDFDFDFVLFFDFVLLFDLFIYTHTLFDYDSIYDFVDEKGLQLNSLYIGYAFNCFS